MSERPTTPKTDGPTDTGPTSGQQEQYEPISPFATASAAPDIRPAGDGIPDAALELSVIILNYNAAADLRCCLASLAAGCAGLRFETIVVDNASPRPGVEAAVAGFPGVRLIRRRRNGGFSAGMNTGLRAARAEAALILNPDTVLAPGAAPALLAAMRADPSIGVLGPRLLNPDGSLQLSCRRFPTFAASLFNRNSLLTRLLPRNRFSRSYLMTDWDHSRSNDVDWLSGAAMLLNQRALRQVGPFDPGFFFEIEDVDLCRRMHDAGYRVVYFPEATVTHEIGASSRTAQYRVIRARHEGMWRYYRRYMGGNLALDTLTGAALFLRCLVYLARERARRTRRQYEHGAKSL